MYNNTIIQEDMLAMSKAPLPWAELDGKTVLVTGATGMLASYLTWLLLFLRKEKNIDVSVIALCIDKEKADRYFAPFESEPWFRLLLQDVCDPIDCDGPVDYIFHLAGNASPHFINTNPVGIMKCNLQGTLSVLELARRKGTKAVVFASTREVYGKNEEAALLNENDFGVLNTLDDRSSYPESKRAAETLLHSYHLQYGTSCRILRIAHSYGPTMRLDGDGRVMADLMADAVAGRDIVLKSAGDAERAFLYVTDAVTGMFTALLLGEPFSAYNLSNETEPVLIRDLACRLASLCKNGSVKVIRQVLPASGKGYCAYRRTALDTSALRQLGWKPEVTLDEGLRRVLEAIQASSAGT